MAEQAKATLAQAMADLQRAQDALLASKLDASIAAQRRVEEEALLLTKSVNTQYQRAVKWKSEQKRFRSSLEGLDGVGEWARRVEKDLAAIAGNLEYVCAVIERGSAEGNGAPPSQ